MVLFIDKYTCAKRKDKEMETYKSDKKDRPNFIQMEKEKFAANHLFSMDEQKCGRKK